MNHLILKDVASVKIVSGSEVFQSNSQSMVLKIAYTGCESPEFLFMKRVSAMLPGAVGRPWFDRRRTLTFGRTEMRFYRDFPPVLEERGVVVPHCAGVNDQLQALFGGVEALELNTPPEDLLRNSGAQIFLECVDKQKYFQTSPLSKSQALAVLSTVAGFHSASWEDCLLLGSAAEQLQRQGGSFTLSVRNPKELAQLRDSWSRFVEHFAPLNPTVFTRPSVANLGARLESIATWVSRQLHAGPTDACACVVHGDLKAMNVFLPLSLRETQPLQAERPESPQSPQPSSSAVVPCLLIDFASTGVGYGMSDVAMFLWHSVDPSVLEGGGEGVLLDAYLAALSEQSGWVGARKEQAYPRAMAMRHYHLGVVDYARLPSLLPLPFLNLTPTLALGLWWPAFGVTPLRQHLTSEKDSVIHH